VVQGPRGSCRGLRVENGAADPVAPRIPARRRIVAMALVVFHKGIAARIHASHHLANEERVT